MLVSREIKQTDTFAVSTIGYIVNGNQINFIDLPLIYFADIINDEKLKLNASYSLRHFFFTNKTFSFNDNYNTFENIKKQIDLLNDVNETYINKIIETNNIPYDLLIQFYIDLIYYLLDKLILLSISSTTLLEMKYKLLLKNCEMLILINKNNSNIINNLRNLYNELKV